MLKRKLQVPFDGFDAFAAEMTYDSLGRYTPSVRWEAHGANTFHCMLAFDCGEEIRQDDWQLNVTPAFRPDFHWSPHLTPTDEHIADQHSFRSPALIAQGEGRLLILIPDIDVMSRGTPVRWYMDLDAARNRLTLGMSEASVTDHVLFRRAPGAAYPPGRVDVGFYLMTFEGESMPANPWRPVLDLFWTRWGSPSFRQGAPRIGEMERYVEHTYRWAFDTWKDSVWQQFDLEGKTVGAPAFIVNVTQSPNYPGVPSEREVRSIWNQAWFSSLRSAQGVYRYGTAKGDDELVRRALMAKELALAAPQIDGLFPSVIGTPMETAEIDGQRVHRSQGWERHYWGNSNRNPIDPWGSPEHAPYHILDMSWTALLMLRWYEELERDDRLLRYAGSYADKLLSLQTPKGYFPAWLHKDTFAPYDVLTESPETSLSVTFLLKLYDIGKAPEHLEAALKAMNAVIEEIVPIGRWEDFETYWSCSPYGRDELLGRKLPRNNMYKQCNFSMFWTAEALLQCYRVTGEARYLDIGERCLDELLMTQASWQPPYIYVEALGGFGVMNCDGEWNDARQSLFAELILQYGRELGRTEYIERGVAALRASFVMMYCPENEKTKEQWEKAFPYFNASDYGFMMENYGHMGETSAEGVGMGTFTIFDWGNGAAAEAYTRIKAHFGLEIGK